MGLPQSQISYTVEEYLSFERQAEKRHEYLGGQIYAMAGESLEHSTINANLTMRLGIQLVGTPCRVLSPNMKVRTYTSGLYAYPDAAVVCGEPLFHDEHRDILINPTVIIKVLSPSTEAYDRGEKFLRYRQLETLADYVLVAQSQPLMEHFERQPDQRWLYSAVNDLSGSMFIASISCELRLAEVYDRIVFSVPGLPS